MAAGDLTNLAAIETLLGDSSGNADEAKLSLLITAASAAIVTYCARNFVQASYAETRNGNHGRSLVLAQKPVSAVGSVTIDGISIPAGSPGMTAGYLVRPMSPQPDAASSVVLVGYRFTRGAANVVIGYTAGYATIPADLAQACNELVMLHFKSLPHFDVGSEGLAGQSTNYIRTAMRPETREVLDRYKRVSPSWP